jgi:hypothetical protein
MNKQEHLEKIKQKCQELIESYKGIDGHKLAESGWRSTIAAIDYTVRLKNDIDAGWKNMCIRMQIKDYEQERDVWPEIVTQIIAAWPEDLL